jgi:DNA-directed RNA polymerase subunit RPC12/RpoP
MDIMSMKSSRRKQSKPIRVSYNDDTEMPLPAPGPPGEEEFVNGENMDTNDVDQEKENKCNETFPGENMSAMKSDVNDSSPINLATREIAFPTAYHRLANEFSMKNSFVPNGHNNSVMDAENNIDKNGNDVVDGEFGEKNDGEKPKDRSGIFHPDAYCELCDKEFCNKYFLKTHKANKHGIYDNSSSPFPPSMNPLPPSLVLPQDYSTLPFKLNMDFPLPPLKPNTSSAKPPTPQLTPTQLPASSPHRQSPPTTQSLSQTPTKPPQSPLPSNMTKPPISSSSSSTSSENGDKKSVSQDMEDFCEICQKHFCNKYYLKKHKNDVHGIAPPDTPMSGKRGGRPPNSEMKLPATPVTSDSPFIPQSLANLPGLPNMPGVMVLNPFLPPMLIPGSLMNQHGPMHPRPPHLPLNSPLPYSSSASMPVTSTIDAKSISPGSSSSTSATSSSPSGSITAEALRNLGIPIPDGTSPSEALRRMGLMSPDGQITSDVLRGMGVLGAEAFCDICRKEFCNKYFLKIHKANKHGIFTDEPLLPPSMAAAMSMSLPNKPSDSTTNTSDNNRSSEKEMKDSYESNKPDSSPKAATTPISQPSEYITHCNLCSQEFASKYAYRIHRIQAHGMINEPFNEAELAEEAFRLHNGDLPKQISVKIAEEISAMERNSEAAGFSTMFGSMVAAKLADRVTCDICNKELCNKYFLKVHKMKVHGIDIGLQERSPKPGTTMQSERMPPKLDFSPSAGSRLDFSPSAGGRLDFSNFQFGRNFKSEPKEPSHSRPNSTQSMASADTSLNMSVERPSNEELVKMGMDPEAYCEICKKEFCSKYFLRTHKQNIHGIPPKTESQESSLSLPKSLSMAPHLALSTPLLPSSFMSSVAPYAQTKPMNLSASNGSLNSIGSNGRSKSSLPNKWKEPQNSSRVTCELCNKELCNKYFLRTHKINKHGMLPEEMSPLSSQNMSPNTSDIETSSNSSYPDKGIQSPKLNLENSKLFTNRSDDGPLQFSEALNLKIKSESEKFMNMSMNMSMNMNNNETEICHLCSRKFKSSKWLRQHILKDHAGLTSLSPTMEKAFNIGGRYAPLELRTCSVCSIVFPSEMSMQLHMIQEHNAQVTIKTDTRSPPLSSYETRGQFSGTVKKYGLKPKFSFSVKQKSYNCSVCSHKSKWLSTILSHERSVHGINHNMKKFGCKSCRKVFRTEKAFQLHMMKVHGDYSMSSTRTSKQYRCTTCDRSFPNVIDCHLHIRRDHIRGHSFRVNSHQGDIRHRCPQCSFQTRFKKQYQRHILRCHNVPAKVNRAGFMDESNSGKTNIHSLNLHAEALNGCGDYTMQTFEIRQCNEDGVFVSSVVEMPVLQKLTDSTSVSFVVTPIDDQQD